MFFYFKMILETQLETESSNAQSDLDQVNTPESKIDVARDSLRGVLNEIKKLSHSYNFLTQMVLDHKTRVDFVVGEKTLEGAELESMTPIDEKSILDDFERQLSLESDPELKASLARKILCDFIARQVVLKKNNDFLDQLSTEVVDYFTLGLSPEVSDVIN